MAQEQQNLSVDQIILEAVSDAPSYYHGAALRSLLTYQPGNVQAIKYTISFLNRLLEIEMAKSPSN